MEFNKVFLYGNLTRDPETRHTQSGTQVATFNVAVNERRGKEESVMFVRVETWSKTAELVNQYLRKGSGVLIEGRLKIDEYETREGQKRRDPVVVADRVSFGPKPAASGGGPSGPASPSGQSGQGQGGQGSREARAEEHSRAKADGYAPQGAGGPGEGQTNEDDLPF